MSQSPFLYPFPVWRYSDGHWWPDWYRLDMPKPPPAEAPFERFMDWLYMVEGGYPEPEVVA